MVFVTDDLCHATANALKEGSILILGHAIYEGCYNANALKRNATVTDLEIHGEFDEPSSK
jgi:hypothetical protein